MIHHRNIAPSRSLLASSRLDVTLDDLMARYELRHRFHNDRSTPVEIVYTFPVPLDAAFLGMEATLAGETRIARVQPRHNARKTFDNAIADGDSAVLLERLEPGLLCVDLGNLKPGEDGEIVLRFAAALAVADGIARFSLPLVHRPRYGRSHLDELATPGHDFAVEHPLDATIRVTGRLTNAPVQCASHAVRFERDGDALLLSLGHAALDRDLVLNFDLPQNATAAFRMVTDENGAIGLLDLTAPKRETSKTPMDICLVLDGSGSMSGDAIAQSRAALATMIDALDEEDRVQVLRFGSSVVPLFRRPLRATERVREAMRALTRTVDANLGGTEIGSALATALDGLEGGDAKRARAIILVTDGAVQPHELDAARERSAASDIRIFVVAVGSSAGADVLAPLAEDTGAVLERAVPAEPIDLAVLRQFRRARFGAPLGIEVHWGEGARPLPPPQLYPGDAATLVAFLPDAAARSVQFRFGSMDALAVLSSNHAMPDPARRAWAGQQAYAHAGESHEREAIALRHGLIAKETSAVLVKVRAASDRIQGLPEIAPVAHMTPHGMLQSVVPALMFRQSSAPLSADDSFLPIPTFLRHSTAHDTDRHHGLDHVAEDQHLLMECELSSARIDAIRSELRRALEALLLRAAPERFTLAALLAALDPELREDIQAWLAVEGIQLEEASAAAKFLLDLVADGAGEPLPDEHEAMLSALQFGVG